MNQRIKQDNPIIGKNIRLLREKNGLRNIDIVTQLQLKGVNMNTSTLSKIERGHSNPTTNMLIALTDIFQCDFNTFFSDKDSI